MTASSQTSPASGPTPPEIQPGPLRTALPDLVHLSASDAAVRASAAQAGAEAAAEISELRHQLAVMAGSRRQRDAVLRLCEGRRGDDLLLVSAVAAAAECGTTALDGFPMALTWSRTAAVPAVDAGTGRAVVHCATPYGGRADLVVEDVERQALAAALDTPIPGAPCLHAAGSDPVLFGWSRLDVAGSGDGPRWYCSPACVSRALARAGAELAAADALFPGAGADEATCVGCGCTEDIPCPGGCYWVHTAGMSDLCSACASPQQLAAAAAAALAAGEGQR
ncbi:hypothetical protein [Streptomyces sp. SHP 1-2]|uniref:hypothetical protein n=1 Tax=Streptomyces sp. SHP 1-2 TaxID=2769489 RepID=UPI00223731C7|nr:hypothetical protein [Streptomyces sp. SHP 1-2]MCW5252245.1 hypothetical protein [Streptomyces sp. SHP 1-2]